MEPEPAERYLFGPLERRGLVAGWRAGQVAVVACALLVAVAVLRLAPSIAGLAVALLVAVTGVAAATWPIAGRSAEQWAPDALRHARRVVERRARLLARPFSTLELLEVEAARRRVGVVHDRLARTYTAVLAARAPGFVLLGQAEQSRRVAQWATVLAAMARQGSAVHRLQWVARALPDDGRAVERHLDAAGRSDAPPGARSSYRALLAAEPALARRHEVLLVVSVLAGRRGGARRPQEACSVLVRQLADVRALLRDCGMVCDEVLNPAEMAAALRRGFEPGPREARSTAPGGHPWPMATEARWDHLRTDATWHVTYWVAEWPRVEVGPEFLAPLLVSDVRRTVSLVMEPLPPVEAARRAEQARTADIADAELRRRGGFLATARRRREEEVASRREAELADGHGPYRFTGYVTVSALDRAALDDACARTEEAAARAGLELRRCYGDQDRTFTCTLPLGRGLH